MIITPSLLYGVDEAWLRLLYYEKSGNTYKNDASHDYFFVTKEGRSNPQLEWDNSVLAIKDRRKVGQLKKEFQCAFPARYELIIKKNPELKQNRNCPEFIEWKNEIGAKEIYLVYASSYVSNPASMFGHSFLRFSRGGKKRSDSLLDYSVGFMALTNPDDNAIMYSVKGIVGGYIGHFDIKPFYMQVGLYQNAEDRDLWEYKLPLSAQEVDLIIKHMWEVSRNTGFPYYFFDENCSYYVIKLIEAVNKNWNVTNKRSYIFAHPIETLKWVKKRKGLLERQHFESINKVLRRRISQMSKDERKAFKKAKSDLVALKEIKSIAVLDALIDYWKFENYDKKTILTKKEHALMDTTFSMRAQSRNRLKDEKNILRERGQDPQFFHDPNKLTLGLSQTSRESVELEGSYALGYHGLIDNPRGHDDFSYIDYFSLSFKYKKSFKIKRVKFIEINSHAPFYWELPKLSWRFDSYYDNEKVVLRKKNSVLEGGLGLTLFISERSFQYSFVNIQNRIHSRGVRLLPEFRTGLKLVFNNFIINPEYSLIELNSKERHSAKSDFAYYWNENNGVIGYLKNTVGESQQFEFGMKYRIYL